MDLAYRAQVALRELRQLCGDDADFGPDAAEHELDI
ncbi:MAG: hypothetical protein CAPSK01_004569 [Candidatus Accumulibacter vicinus]|uniref:Uncharacterized protein n=1 Tax=Candidatus Accumulibacter vicinus TaxID=2954382 RepID=A0A084XUQ6_9PROT|nr:MAG: hypothetical protein CAPSK01_004569 [Candidatus Accumulibacter vicinus]